MKDSPVHERFPSRSLWLGCLVALALTAGPLVAQPEEVPATKSEQPPELPPAAAGRVVVEKARLVSTPGHRDVKEIRRLRPGGGRLDWSLQGDWIAFDERGPDGLYDLWVSRGDGTAASCLTCDRVKFRNLNALNPTWHPSGMYLAFQVQDAPRKLELGPLELATPMRGLFSEVWIITRDGRDSWQISRSGPNGGAVLDPCFSHEANLLLWSERFSTRLRPWGEWGVQVAEFRVRRGLPDLGKVRTYRFPQQPLLLATGFTPNDRGVIAAASSSPLDRGLDLFVLDLTSETREPLTRTPDFQDEAAQYTPRGDQVIWTSDRGIAPTPAGGLPRHSDLWVMDVPSAEGPGGRQERLTFFNDPQSPHFLGEALLDDFALNPAGDQLAVHVISRREPGAPLEEALELVQLAATHRR